MAAVGQRRPPRSAGHTLASFYLIKAYITTYNNQLIRPNQRCANDDFAVSLEDDCVAIDLWLPKT
jgi:hypothetical protein